MLRLIASIVAGLAVAFAIVFATDALFHALSPPGEIPDPADPAAMQAYVARQPVLLLAATVAGWAVAALVGAAIAARFGRRGAWPGWAVAGLFLLATVANFAMVTHPAWMVAAALALIVAAGWTGARVGARASPPRAAIA